MARNTLKATRTELYQILAPGGVSAIAGATVVDHEPRPGDLQSTGGVAITVATTGMTPTSYLLAVRIYSSVHVNAKKAQDDLDDMIEAVDAHIVAQSDAYGPSDWTIEYDPDTGGLVATNSLQVGREDHWDR